MLGAEHFGYGQVMQEVQQHMHMRSTRTQARQICLETAHWMELIGSTVHPGVASIPFAVRGWFLGSGFIHSCMPLRQTAEASPGPHKKSVSLAI